MNSPLLPTLFSTIYFYLVESKKKKIHQAPSVSHNEKTLQYIFIASGILALVAILVYLLHKRSQLMRAEKLRSIKRALQVKEQSKKNKPCTMTQMQKDQAIAWFRKNNWILEQFQGKQGSQKTPLKIFSIKRKQQIIDGSLSLKDYYDAFYFQMKGGSSMIFGVIMFQKYFPTILFEKSVSSSKNQSGNYNYKFFEGPLKKGQFEGRWYTSNDMKIERQRQISNDKDKNLKDQSLSERSLSNGDISFDGIKGSNRSKTQTGSFKLYHQ